MALVLSFFQTLLILLFSSCSFAEEAYSCRLKVAVSADDSFKNELLSLLNRGFRQISDLVLTDSDPGLIVNVVSLRLKNGLYVASVLASTPTKAFENMEGVGYKLQGVSCNKEGLNLINKFISGTVRNNSHWVLTDPELERLCRTIIADVDVNVIEPERKMDLDFKDTLQKIHDSTEKLRRQTKTFMASHPCPSTGTTQPPAEGRVCPGYVIKSSKGDSFENWNIDDLYWAKEQ
jgi:hypothetical protein